MRNQEDPQTQQALTEPFLNLQFFFKLDLVCNLLVFFHQIQAFRQDWIVLEPILSNLHQHLDHVLHSVADAAFIEDSTEPLENNIICLGGIFCKEGANLAHETNCDFDGVISWMLQEEHEDLKGNEVVSNGLIDEVSNEGSTRVTNNL